MWVPHQIFLFNLYKIVIVILWLEHVFYFVYLFSYFLLTSCSLNVTSYFIIRTCLNIVFLLQFQALIIYCCSFFIIWFHIFFLLVHKEDWGILFWMILAMCFSKMDRNLFCLAWNYLNISWQSSIISILHFAPSFILIYLVLNFACF